MDHSLAKRIVSLFLFLFSVGYLVEALSLPLGTSTRAGPGLIPTAAGLFLTFFTLCNLVGDLLGKKEPPPQGEASMARKDVFRIVGVIFILVFYGVFLKTLGFIPTSVILVFVVLRLLGMNNWLRISLISALTSVASYYLFSVILDVPLPRGIFFS
jgi:putative tricarboxylic transport membrane protein